MDEIYEKVKKLKQTMDNLDVFKRLEESIFLVKDNKELVEKIKKYNLTPDDNLRLEIYKYEEIKKYKQIENEINLLILEINHKMRKINNNRSC